MATATCHYTLYCNGVASHCNDCNERVVIDDFYFIELKLGVVQPRVATNPVRCVE